MAQPPAYDRSKDFQKDYGSETDHAALNAELDRISTSINRIRDNLGVLQADDLKLRPEVVTSDSISKELRVSLVEGVIIDAQGMLDRSLAAAEASAGSAAASAEYAAASSSSAVASAESAEEAYRWANMPEDEEVTSEVHPDEYSAFHHAQKAKQSNDNAAGSAAASAESAQEAWGWANTPENQLVQAGGHVGYSAWHHAQKAKENADAAASAIMPGALVGQLFYGQIVLSAVPLDSDGLCLLDGSQLEKGSRYDKFIAHIAGLKEKHPDLFVTETAWWAIDKEFGSCGKFVLGEDNLRLPKVSSILECTTDAAAVGEIIEAGLPNITGNVTGGRTSVDENLKTDGAFYITGHFVKNLFGTGGLGFSQVAFDASRSNPLYGASDTVQPQTLKVLAYIVVDAVDVDALNKLLKTVNEGGQTGQTLTKGEDGAEWADAATLARTGNFKDGVFIGPEPFVDGPMILTPDDVGKHFYMSTSVPVGANINLPDSSLCHTGSVISFHSVAATPTFRINTIGTDTIGVIGGPLTTLLVPPNSYLAFINVMAGRWELLIQECAVPWKLWQKVSRAVGVTYTNESGRHKIVSANALSSSTAPAYINIVLPGGNIYFCDSFVGQKGIGVSAQAIIAPGEQYHFEIGGVATVTYLEKEL